MFVQGCEEEWTWVECGQIRRIWSVQQDGQEDQAQTTTSGRSCGRAEGDPGWVAGTDLRLLCHRGLQCAEEGTCAARVIEVVLLQYSVLYWLHTLLDLKIFSRTDSVYEITCNNSKLRSFKKACLENLKIARTDSKYEMTWNNSELHSLNRLLRKS